MRSSSRLIFNSDSRSPCMGPQFAIGGQVPWATVGYLTFWRPGRLSSVLTSLKSWVRPDRFHAVLSERSARWYNACLRITRDADLAADAVQEALLKAWDRRNEFRGDSELDTWIHRIALNAAIDLMRRRRPQAVEEIQPE